MNAASSQHAPYISLNQLPASQHQHQHHEHQAQNQLTPSPPNPAQFPDKPRSPSPREFLAIPDCAVGAGSGAGGGWSGWTGGGGTSCQATSPTSLTVPLWFNTSSGGSEFWRRVSSTSSSIFDLTAECEQLERAIKDNDVTAVKKFLQIHHGKFPVDLATSILDKSSCDSRSRRHSHVSQDVEILLLKSQTLIESFDRRESINTESDVPSIFKTSLHLAVHHGADEVLKLLLKFGVDPNEPSTNVTFPATSRRHRRTSSIQPEMLLQQMQQLHLRRQQYLQMQKQRQVETMSWDGRSRLSCCSQHSGIISAAAIAGRTRSKSCSPTIPPTITLLTSPPPPPSIPTITPSMRTLPSHRPVQGRGQPAPEPLTHGAGVMSTFLGDRLEEGKDSIYITVDSSSVFPHYNPGGECEIPSSHSLQTDITLRVPSDFSPSRPVAKDPCSGGGTAAVPNFATRSQPATDSASHAVKQGSIASTGIIGPSLSHGGDNSNGGTFPLNSSLYQPSHHLSEAAAANCNRSNTALLPLPPPAGYNSGSQERHGAISADTCVGFRTSNSSSLSSGTHPGYPPSPKVIVSPDTSRVTERRDSVSGCSSAVSGAGGVGGGGGGGGGGPVQGPLSRLQLPDITEARSEDYSGNGTSAVDNADAATFDIAATYSAGSGGDDLLCLPPLFQAVLEGRSRAVRLLLRYGACPHVQDRHGCTPLHLACTPQFLNEDCCHFLLRYGAKVHVPNWNAVTPCHLYCRVAEKQRSLVNAALSRILSIPTPRLSSTKKRSSGGGGGFSATTTNTTAAQYSNPLSSDSTTPGASTGGNQRTGSVTRFFKRLSSKSRSVGRERRSGNHDETSTTSAGVTSPTGTTTFSEMRERASSLSSCRSFRSRHYSSCIVDDLESDISLVSLATVMLGHLSVGISYCMGDVRCIKICFLLLLGWKLGPVALVSCCTVVLVK